MNLAAGRAGIWFRTLAGGHDVKMLAATVVANRHGNRLGLVRRLGQRQLNPQDSIRISGRGLPPIVVSRNLKFDFALAQYAQFPAEEQLAVVLAQDQVLPTDLAHLNLNHHPGISYRDLAFG